MSEEPGDAAPDALRVRATQILCDALVRYSQPDGYEGYLVKAARQLEEMGREAWYVLSDLVKSGLPECDYFLGALVRIEGVSEADRKLALIAAAKSKSIDVRSRLLELLEEVPETLRAKVLDTLAAPQRPDDTVTDRARELRDTGCI